MESISNDDWEQKCSGLNLLQILIAQYPDTITQNLHQVVLILIQEVKNLRSQVARFALSTFCDMFKNLKRNMDIELDITVKAIIQKSAESNEFFRSDAEKCLQMMVDNVTLQKALQALIAGGARELKFVFYFLFFVIDCGVLIQPLCTLSQNSNLRIRPEIVLKLANLVPRVCQRKQKQVEIHLLPTYWKLLSLLRGQNSTTISTSASGSNSLNSSIHVLTMALYTELGSVLIEKASSSSLVTPQNLQLLRELCTNISTE
ncbi:unnamed protein product [Rotaria sp. Silwood1]|nr:unnamed protein product [Rotaria sp. Silwood1]CAF5003283.1 unnamed protein product [Rotaria sp. Silwood1]